MTNWFRRLSLSSALLVFVVVVFGAYVRLTDAGLGCPDWPGCYGTLTVPSLEDSAVQIAFPDAEIDIGKAWREMIHRYLAGVLGLLILAMAIMAWRHRRDPQQPTLLPYGLLALVIFQSMLGMWTVTMLVKPVIVTLHLLMGMATLALVWLLYFRVRRQVDVSMTLNRPGIPMKGWALGALLVIYAQIALGGWVSTNYAALHCPDFPTCQTHWWPETDFRGAFTLVREVGVNYEGGRLTNTEGVTVHLTHRLGAIVVLLYFLLMLYKGLRYAGPQYRNTLILIGALLTGQILIGIGNVIYLLPLSLAVAHNAGAALLLLAIVYLNYIARRPSGLQLRG
jgi:cytochrome c oxidase assembly protein subunit 15